ncbi:MAG: FixH family protein [Pseudomonadota bacterium]
MDVTNHTQKRFTGWHALACLLGFFGVGFAVNGVFVYHAVSSFPGEEIKKSYVQGLTYNDTLEARARQADLGWRAEMGLQGETLVLHLETQARAPLSGYAVSVVVQRAATDADDRVIALQSVGAGRYEAELDDLKPGLWRIRAIVSDGDGEPPIFTADKAIEVQ